MTIFQTTIQRFFIQDGIDYAMAMDVENDIFLFDNRNAALTKNAELCRNTKSIYGSTYESCIANPDNTVNNIHHADGTRTVIKTIKKEIQ